MKLLLVAAAIGGAYYAHTQGYDLWTASAWQRLISPAATTTAPAGASSSPISPNAGVPPMSSPVLSPVVDGAAAGCGCGGSCGGCGSNAAPSSSSSSSPVSTKNVAAVAL